MRKEKIQLAYLQKRYLRHPVLSHRKLFAVSRTSHYLRQDSRFRPRENHRET